MGGKPSFAVFAKFARYYTKAEVRLASHSQRMSGMTGRAATSGTLGERQVWAVRDGAVFDQADADIAPPYDSHEPIAEEPFFVAFARRNSFAMGALYLAIDQGYE